jgi:hypothetical protein
MRRAGGTLLALALLAAAGPLRADIDYEQFTRLTASLLKIESFNADGSVSIGTGVVVARGAVATNCHVTRRATSVALVKGALRAPAHSQQADVEHDLCILYAAEAEHMVVAAIRREPLRIGQPVTAVGYIFGIAPRLNAGAVVALHDYAGGRVIQSSTPFTSGASGGGLFDAQGLLVGIVTFRSPSGVANHFSIPVQWVSAALDHGAGSGIVPLSGEHFWQRPRAAQPAFLQVAALEAEGNWFGVADVAQRWSADEPEATSAWLALGKAQQRLKQSDASIATLNKALALDPQRADIWYELGLAHAGNGDAARTHQVHDTLLGLDRNLAGELARHTIECAPPAITVC